MKHLISLCFLMLCGISCRTAAILPTQKTALKNEYLSLFFDNPCHGNIISKDIILADSAMFVFGLDAVDNHFLFSTNADTIFLNTNSAQKKITISYKGDSTNNFQNFIKTSDKEILPNQNIRLKVKFPKTEMLLNINVYFYFKSFTDEYLFKKNNIIIKKDDCCLPTTKLFFSTLGTTTYFSFSGEEINYTNDYQSGEFIVVDISTLKKGKYKLLMRSDFHAVSRDVYIE